MKYARYSLHVLLVILLTAITQVGGLLWLFALLFALRYNHKKRYIFPVLYIVFNVLFIPPIAKLYGRTPLPVFSSELKPKNIIYPLLFRNYVSKELKILLEDSAHVLYKSDIITTYLDACFPFFDGFPLLPHLSHNDGKKVDIAFMYLSKNGTPTNNKPSFSGYGAFVKENNKTSEYCINTGHWQYDFTKYFNLGTDRSLKFDKKKTRQLLLQLSQTKDVDKIFLEPYLKEMMGLSDKHNIRFHGCKAVRHDDHIHLQIK